MDVQLPSSLWYTNQGSTVQSIAIDFNDGLGYQTVNFGQLKTVSYTQPGVKEWKYKLTLTNNLVLYSQSKIQIDAEVPPVNNTALQRTINEPCSVNGFGIDEVEFYGTRHYLGVSNSATLEIDYAGTSGCGTISKPLIVVEGFDSGLLGVENALGENSYRNFRQSTFASGNLFDEVSTYDIIYVNWNKGTDYLQRNAYLLEDIIKWINQQKALAGSTTPNVVLGQSMGGVIARFALRDMENQHASTGNNTWNYQTNLYISHDAPHQGANIPLGIQYFARHLVDQFVSTPLGDMNINPNAGSPVTIEDIEALMNAPGTKQLLANYITSGFAYNNTIGDAWRTELKNLGYPQQTRNIAISNGSHCAEPQEFNPSATLFSLSGNGKTSFLTSFLTELLGPLNLANDLAFIGLAILFDEPGLLIGILPGNSIFNMNFNAKALPNVNTTSQIYKGKLTFTKKLFWLLNITVTLTDRSYNNPFGILSYDYYPGGKYPVPFDFQNSSANTAFYSFGISAVIADNFNFVPTPSALDVGSGNAVLYNSDYFTKFNLANPPVGLRAIPFANFTTSYNTVSINEDHISFNTRNGNWLATELDINPLNTQVFDCTFMCDNGAIGGPGLICGSANFSLGDATTTTTWTLTPSNSGSITVNNNANITVTSALGYSGNVVLTANISSARCGSATITKNLHFGGPTSSGSVTISGDSELDAGPIDSAVFSVNTANMASYSIVNWLVYSYTDPNANNYFQFQPQGNGETVIVQAASNTPAGDYIIQARITNACGFFPVDKSFHVNNGPPVISLTSTTSDDNIYRVFPNPSSDIVNIALNSGAEQPIQDVYESGELFDVLGISRLIIPINQNNASFSVVNLQTGIYVLKIYMNDQVESHQIIVE